MKKKAETKKKGLKNKVKNKKIAGGGKGHGLKGLKNVEGLLIPTNKKLYFATQRSFDCSNRDFSVVNSPFSIS